MMPAKAETATDSSRLRSNEMRKGMVAQRMTVGAITRVPAASASHQVNQVTTESERLGALARMNPARTMAELIIAVGAMTMIANFAVPEAVENARRPFDQRPISHVPANAARSVPIQTEPNSRIDRSAMR